MEKPVSIRLREAKQEIIDTINRQDINPCIMKFIMKEIYELVCNAAETEYNNAVSEQAQTQETES